MKKIKYNTSDQNIWFTSDLHLNHKSVLEYCSRPFDTVIEMNTTIIENWNRVVKEDDIVFLLGDVTFHCNSATTHNFLSKLNGTIHLVLGNHDFRSKLNRDAYKKYFKTTSYLEDIQIIDNEHAQLITLCHYPMLSWNKSQRGAWQLHGHIHSTPEEPYLLGRKECQYDVGVDNNNFTPISYNELKLFLK